MAAEKSAAASGLDFETQSTRRRNVPSATHNGATPNKEEVDEKKTQGKSEQTLLQFLDEWEFIIAPLVFTLLAFFTRLYKIGLSPIVTWDEAQYFDL
jgi:dolichyl-phosphate-mannose-protein mannosyltransferase